LPIFLVGTEGREPTVQIDASSCILGRIELPSRYSQVTTALHHGRGLREAHQESGRQRPVDLFRSLVGSSRAIQQVRKHIQQVADSEANVLILGESGTGQGSRCA